jgi:tRNA (guanine-N7-)-methyltransferase
MTDLDLDLDRLALPLRWPDVFGRATPTDVEIGSGKGKFLLELAQARPERSFLAIERAGKYHRLCCRRAAKRGIDNVRLIRTTAEDLLFRLLAPDSVDTIYVLFPDPWPKKRHHKRRLFKPDVASAMASVLRPGGRLLVKTDHPGYAEVIGSVLESTTGLLAIDAGAAFEGLPLSGFESKYAVEGRKVFAWAYERPT